MTLVSACGDLASDSVQVGYRGVALEQNYNRSELQAKFAAQTIAPR